MKTVLLLGDSIRVGYDKSVKKTLEGAVNVYFPKENCRFAAYLLRNVHTYQKLIPNGDEVALVHWNAGLWDCLRCFGEEPQSLDRFARMSQASQAEAMKFFVERFRSGKWKRTGIIWWNLIDGWPQFSDAVTDYYYARKLAYYVIKRSQQPICLMFREPTDGRLALVGANEYREDVSVSYLVRDLKTGLTVCEGTAMLAKNSAQTVDFAEHLTDGMHFYVMEWTSEKHNGKNYYVCAASPYSFDEYSAFMRESGMWEADFLD